MIFSYYINGNTTEFHSVCEQQSSGAGHIRAVFVCANFPALTLQRHLESGICKQNEQREDNPSDNSESKQDDEHDSSTNEEDQIPHSQSAFDPWNKLLK